jgi:hypothetical protein
VNSNEERLFVPITSKNSTSGLAESRSRIHEKIHELTISLRFLGIILRVLRLEVSIYNIYIPNQFQNTFARGRGGE